MPQSYYLNAAATMGKTRYYSGIMVMFIPANNTKKRIDAYKMSNKQERNIEMPGLRKDYL